MERGENLSSNEKLSPIQSKEDAIVFLNQMIVLTYRRMARLNEIIRDIENVIKLYKNKERIETKVFRDCVDKSENTILFLMNIFGDETKNVVSYKQFRKILHKKYENGFTEFELVPLNREIVELLDKCREERNWSHHIPQSLFVCQKKHIEKYHSITNKLVNKVFSDEEIFVSEWEYHEIEWLNNLYEANIGYKKVFQKIFQYMKKDYSKLVGKSMCIMKSKEQNPRPFEFIKIAEDSFAANTNKRR